MKLLTLALIAAGGYVVAKAFGGKKNGVGTIPAYVNFGVGAPAPSPPMQGNGFREGAQPDPAAPNDPNRGRHFAEWGQSKYAGHPAEHEAAILDVGMDANGTIGVDIWAARKGKPERCTKWGSTVTVKDGRIDSAGWSLPKKCGTLNVTDTDVGGCVLKLPTVRWEQRGPTIYLLWMTKVEGKASTSNNDCDEAMSFLVDVFWRFEAG